jgi:raffinose/stachyose/melibiose transport system substrate-binding protein
MRYKGSIVMIVLLSLLLHAIPGLAENKSISVYVNGERLAMTPPLIVINGTTLVPYRPLFEGLGFTVEWDPIFKIITGQRDELTIAMQIGNPLAKVNKKVIQLTEAPFLEEETPYVPLRFISEASGSPLSWDAQNRRIDIDTVGASIAVAKPVKLQLLHTEAEDNPGYDLLMEAISQTEVDMPSLTIEPETIDYAKLRQRIRLMFAAGDPPDMFELTTMEDVRLFAGHRQLLDLTGIIKELGIADQFHNLEPFTVDGKVYGLPTQNFIVGYYYNKRIFEELGVSIPKTMVELEAIAKKAKAAGYIPFAMSDSQYNEWVSMLTANQLWVRYLGDHQQALADGEAKWTAPEMVQAFETFQHFAESGYFGPINGQSDYSDQHEKLMNKVAAMMFDGSWAHFALNREHAVGVEDIGFFAMPDVIDGQGNGLMIGGFTRGYAFSADVTPDQKEGIKSLIKALFTPDMQKKQAIDEHLVPAMKLKTLTGIDPLLADIILAHSQADKIVPPYDLLVPYDIIEEIQMEIFTLLRQGTTPQDMLEYIQQVADGLED